MKKISVGVLVVGLIAAICVGVYSLGKWAGIRVPFVSDSCRAFTDSTTIRLEPDQLTNAATIAAVGTRMQMPPYAITVALATAFQESKMRNITHGDRDSVGLFQQRPSQGWGSLEEIGTPRIATERFFSALNRIPGWQDMSVTDAAQQVQNSAHPTAYAKWELKSRNLASALIGAEGAAVTCVLREDGGQSGKDAATSLQEELLADFGDVPTTIKADPLSLEVTLDSAESEYGWQVTGWLVAKSREFGIQQVRYAGQRWTADGGEWKKDPDADHSASLARIKH